MNARTNPGPGRRRYQRCLAALAVLAVGLGALQVIAAEPVSAAPGDITEFALSSGNSPVRITAGTDGNLWFTEHKADPIGRITPTGTITEFTTGITPDSRPTMITAGPDGNLWFTESVADRIGRITPTGAVTEYTTGITPDSVPDGITTGPDGNLWFTEAVANRIGRITPTGTVTEYTTGIAPGSSPTAITAGPDGNLWFTETVTDRIGRITPTGTVTEFAAGITAGGGPLDITAGPDGNVWFTKFTENNGGLLGRITPDGTVTEYGTGPNSLPTGITAGPDGNMWFTERTGNQIGRLEMSPQVSLNPASHDFGEQSLANTSDPQQFTLTNNSTTRLTVRDASISGANPGDFAISDDQCSGTTVRPAHHNTCTISVTFTPTAAGPRSATLTVPDDAPGSPHTAALTGTGTPAASAVQLSTSPNPSTFGDPVSLTAHVTTAAPVAPTGTVTFTDGATSLGTAVLDGTATLTTSALHGGQRQITATYSGDTNLLTSSTTTGQQVNAAATTLTARPAQLVVQLPGPSGLRLSARLTVTRTGTPAAGQPVTMRVNGTTACTATTTSDGVATCIAPLIYLLGITLHGYTATYPGSPDYQPATGHAGLLG